MRLECSVLLRMLVLALCCTLFSCKDLVQKYKRSNTGLSSLDRKVLYDFRFPVRPPPLDATKLPEPVKVLSSCTPVEKVDGAFTYAAEQESAYLLHCAGTSRIFILSGNKVQLSVDTSYSSIASTYDLNHDDKNELLLVGETKRGGEYSREASLNTFEKNILHPVENLGIVYHDSCSLFAGADEARKQKLINSGFTPYVEAVAVFYIPHSGLEMPNFIAERYRAPCPPNPGTPISGWQLVSR